MSRPDSPKTARPIVDSNFRDSESSRRIVVADKTQRETEYSNVRTVEDNPLGVSLVEELDEDLIDAVRISEPHIEHWTNRAYEMFLLGVDSQRQSNLIINIPQLISTLCLLAEISPPPSRVAITTALNPQGEMVPRLISAGIPVFLKEWEQKLTTDSKPGSYALVRRALVHHDHSKCYLFLTYMILKNLGVEVKITPKDPEKELLNWLKRDLKLTDSLRQPFTLWSEDAHEQIEQNRKCPILAFASHFRYQIRNSSLDCNNLYRVKFKISASTSQGIQYQKIEQSMLIELPVVNENLGVFVLTHSDNCTIKRGSALRRQIKSFLRNEGLDTLSRLYLPVLEEGQTGSVNVADMIVRSIPAADKSFQPNGFGDIANDGAESSSCFNTRLVSNIQHFDQLDIMHAQASNETLVTPKLNKDDVVIDRPFFMFVWDFQRHSPIYMLRVGNPASKPLSPAGDHNEDGKEKTTTCWEKLFRRGKQNSDLKPQRRVSSLTGNKTETGEKIDAFL